ncbi:MAG: cation transporter dimerization domain-containing protein, partial [Ilumatobacteraceae bacterium]
GESASETDQVAIERSLTSAPGVAKLINVRTQHLGPDELLIAAKIEFTADLSIPELAAAINGAEKALRAAVPTAEHVFIEPDIYRAVAT